MTMYEGQYNMASAIIEIKRQAKREAEQTEQSRAKAVSGWNFHVTTEQ